MRGGNISHQEMAGSLLVLFAGVFWGTSGTAQAFAPSGASPFTVGAIRITGGGIFLFILLIFRKGLSWLKGGCPLKVLLPASLGMAGFQFFFFVAIKMTGVAVGTMVAVGGAPMWAGLLGYIIYKEPPEKMWYFSTSLAVIGCVLLSVGGEGLQTSLPGIFMAFSAAFSYALCGMGLKGLRFLYGPIESAALTLCGGSLFLLPLLFFFDVSWLTQWRGVGVALHLGIVATALPYSLFSMGIGIVPVAKAYTLTLTEPLTACILGVLLLGERLSFTSIAGIFFIFSGLALLSLKKKGEIKDNGG